MRDSYSDTVMLSLHTMCVKKDTKPKSPYAIKSGKRVRRCRKDASMTQRELAVAMGYKGDNIHNRIANYERGDRAIGPEEADLLAKIFPKYEAAYFLGAVDEQESAMLVLLRNQRADTASRSG